MFARALAAARLRFGPRTWIGSSCDTLVFLPLMLNQPKVFSRLLPELSGIQLNCAFDQFADPFPAESEQNPGADAATSAARTMTSQPKRRCRATESGDSTQSALFQPARVPYLCKRTVASPSGGRACSAPA